jgi:hypothetical protein
MKKLVLQKNSMFLSERCFRTERNYGSCFYFFPRNGIFRAFFSSADLFGTEFREISVPRNGSERNSESLLLCLSMVQNSEHSSPLRNGSERNSEGFLFRRTDGIPPEQTNCSVYSVFRGIIFLSEIANPLASFHHKTNHAPLTLSSC